MRKKREKGKKVRRVMNDWVKQRKQRKQRNCCTMYSEKKSRLWYLVTLIQFSFVVVAGHNNNNQRQRHHQNKNKNKKKTIFFFFFFSTKKSARGNKKFGFLVHIFVTELIFLKWWQKKNENFYFSFIFVTQNITTL